MSTDPVVSEHARAMQERGLAVRRANRDRRQLAEAVQKVVDLAPVLTEEQIERLRVVFEAVK